MSSNGARGTLIRSGLLVLVGAGGGLAVHALRADGLRVAGFAPPAACESEEDVAAPPLIEPAAASLLCGRTDVVVADTRSARAYAEGHIAGAVHLPCTASSASAEDAIAHFVGARTIIVYGQDTDEAQPVAATLRRRRHADVRVLAGGFAGWAQAGLACASGPCDGCTQTMK